MRKNSAIFILILSQLALNLGAKSPEAVKGVLDLRDIKNRDNFIVRLDGEWEFYWKKLLCPTDFYTGTLKPDYYLKVPSYWSQYKYLERYGYATYRLKVLLPKEFQKPLGVVLPSFETSYGIYFYGTYYSGSGSPGKTAEETKPAYKTSFIKIEPKSDTLEIVVNIANYNHRSGGFGLPVKIGTFRETQRQQANIWAGEWSVISLLAVFSLFFFLFYVFNPKEKLMGALSMTTFGLALRPLFSSNYLIYNFIDLDWTWIIRSEYLISFIIIVGWSWFNYHLYPSKFGRISVWVAVVFFSIAAILTLLLPVKIFSYFVFVYYPIILILIIYPMVRSFTGVIRKSWLDLMYFITYCLLLIGGINDINVSAGNNILNLGYLMTYIVVVFIFFQTALIMYKWIRSFNEKEHLQHELAFVNRNLEVLVNERTQELKKRNEEIEKQNSMIAMKNKQLSDTIQLKNKIFSVIAHDLRSPVVNILYMLNLLKEEQYKDKYDTFASTSIQYAQLVISLLENMLVWGRGQEDKIKFSPEKHDLADIILTNLSIFKEISDKKEIIMNFTQIGTSIAYFDKDLLDIIIRNLLSNAVKYTPRGGRISILMKSRNHTDDSILLKICDNGIGISETKQKYIFTSTEIESTPGTEDEKGTGLGLKLCHELININHGSIEVESREGEGTCFIITLPKTKKAEGKTSLSDN